MLRLLATLLVCALVSGCGAFREREEPGRKNAPERIGETFRHLREPSSAEWGVTLYHLRSPTEIQDDVAMYVETGSGEKGVVAAGRDLFTGFLGPYDLDGLREFFFHMRY